MRPSLSSLWSRSSIAGALSLFLLLVAACGDDDAGPGSGDPDGGGSGSDAGSTPEADSGTASDGAPAAPCAQELTRLDGPIGDLAGDGESLFATTHGATEEVFRVARADGSQPVRLSELTFGSAQRIVVDPENVWVHGSSLTRIVKETGEVSPVADGLFATGLSGRGVAVDATHVYWLSTMTGELLRRPREGEQVQTLLALGWDGDPELWHVEHLALLGGQVYFTFDNRTLYRMNADGTERTELGAPVADATIHGLAPRGEDGLVAIAVSDSDPGMWQFASIQPDGSATTLHLGAGPVPDDYLLDGDTIVYREDSAAAQGLYLLDLGSGEVKSLFRGPVLIGGFFTDSSGVDDTIYASAGTAIVKIARDAAEPFADPRGCGPR